jgi:hypothetical protein
MHAMVSLHIWAFWKLHAMVSLHIWAFWKQHKLRAQDEEYPMQTKGASLRSWAILWCCFYGMYVCLHDVVKQVRRGTKKGLVMAESDHG